MKLVLNGQKRDVPDLKTVAELLDELKLAAGLILVEQNGQVLQRGEFAVTHLAEGDRIEIMRVVAGG